MPIEKLSALKVEKHKKPGMLSDGGGLYLQVTSAGARSWIFRYRLNGHKSSTGKPLSREMGLGSAHDLTLAEARQIASEKREQLNKGIDPIEAKREARSAALARRGASKTFREAAEACIAARRSEWENKKHALQWSSTLERFAYPVIGDMLVSEVERAHVVEVLEPIWNTKRETANRLRGRIEDVIEYAISVGWCPEKANPAERSKRLKMALPGRTKKAVKHFEAMSYKAVGEFVVALRDREGLAARALEFTILTAARPNETRLARWSSIDMSDRSWTVPKGKMKMRREHVVPLSARAIELLKQIPGRHVAGELIFPSPTGGPFSDAAMNAVLKRMGYECTVHGFRSTFTDWAGDMTDSDEATRDFALAHGIPDATRAAYRRKTAFNKRRVLMTQWADFCSKPWSEPPAAGDDNVVQLRSGA